MSFVKYDPSSPNHMVIVEDTHYQCYRGYKIGDKAYNIHEEFEPYTICDLKTYEDVFEISVNSPWMFTKSGSLIAHTYEEENFKKVFITEREMRKRKIKNLFK